MVCCEFRQFNKAYRSLTRIWLSTIVVLVGGKLNAEIERRSAQPPCRPNGRERLRDGTASGRAASAQPKPGARTVSRPAGTSPITRGGPLTRLV
jgi:hypothetical protein